MTNAQADLFGATEARDEGLERVGENAGDQFMRNADMTVMRHFIGVEFITEDVRLKMLEEGLPMPHNPNAWGSWAMRAQGSRCLIVKVGRRRHCRARVSHKRKAEVYRVHPSRYLVPL